MSVLLQWGRLRIVDAADDLVADAGADGQACLDADDALDRVADGGG